MVLLISSFNTTIRIYFVFISNSVNDQSRPIVRPSVKPVLKMHGLYVYRCMRCRAIMSMSSTVSGDSGYIKLTCYQDGQKYQTKQYTQAHCTQKRWWLILDWVTTKENHSRPQFNASLRLT